MGRKPRYLTVNITPTAEAQLDDIWDWNADRYDPDHADAYEDFLIDEANRIGEDPSIGRPVQNKPEYLYIVSRKRKRKSHGHIIVYEVANQAVEILFIFHTAQNWEVRLASL
ncbi:MAG TPA: type II toxin-antitoxin system RelE/ParE family toxin [Fimbriimonadaceae bacterium]|jgi:plasmid stabilization system protein ParE